MPTSVGGMTRIHKASLHAGIFGIRRDHLAFDSGRNCLATAAQLLQKSRRLCVRVVCAAKVYRKFGLGEGGVSRARRDSDAN